MGISSNRRHRPRPTTYTTTTTTFPFWTSTTTTTTTSTTSLGQHTETSTNSTPLLKETTTPPLNCKGSLSLYNSTYLRGDSLEVSQDLESLPSLWDNKAVSLEVTGDCCWRLFQEPNFMGVSKVVSNKEKYKGVLSLRPLVLDVSSVRKDWCL